MNGLLACVSFADAVLRSQNCVIVTFLVVKILLISFDFRV